jgi:hypothetical protein
MSDAITNALLGKPAPAVEPVEVEASPLQSTDFTYYDTVADGTLELKELKSSGKLDEFVARFYATPEGAAAYFVGHFSRALTDHLKEDIAAKLDSPELDLELRPRLEYWAAHDFKRSPVTASGETAFYYQGVQESMSMGGVTTEETTSVPMFGLGAKALTETELGSWKWYNNFSAGGAWQYGSYHAETGGIETADGTEEGGYGFAAVSSEAKLREQAALNASFSYDATSNPLPEAQLRSLTANAGGSYAWTLTQGRAVEAEVGGGYIERVDAPPSLEGQGQSSYHHVNATGSLAYQDGGRGLILSSSYYDIRSANDFETLDMGLAEGTLTYRSDPWKGANLSLGGGGARSTYDSDLTDLTTEEGQIRLNVGLMTPIAGRFSSETSFSGGASSSSGSLNGWYGEVEKASQTLRYTADTFSLGLTLSANGYARDLDYVDASGASSGQQSQTQFGKGVGVTSSWAPADWMSARAGLNWNVTDQEGFQAVDTDRFSGSLSTSFRLTGESARRALWLDISAYRSGQTSRFGEDSYDHAETNAMAMLTVK